MLLINEVKMNTGIQTESHMNNQKKEKYLWSFGFKTRLLFLSCIVLLLVIEIPPYFHNEINLLFSFRSFHCFLKQVFQYKTKVETAQHCCH